MLTMIPCYTTLHGLQMGAGSNLVSVLNHHLFPPGTNVELVGLNAEDLNGKHGVVVAAVVGGGATPAVGRVPVRLEGATKPKAIAFQNLLATDDTEAADLLDEGGGEQGRPKPKPKHVYGARPLHHGFFHQPLAYMLFWLCTVLLFK